MIPSIFLCFVVVVAVDLTQEVSESMDFRNKYKNICSALSYHLVMAKFGKENHYLCLKFEKFGTSPLASNRSVLLLDPDAPDTQHYPLHHVTLAYGFPVAQPSMGSAEGYIGEDHYFYGVLYLGNRTLQADPYGRNAKGTMFSGFDNDYIVAPSRHRRNRPHVQTGEHEHRHDLSYQQQSPGVAPARVCELLLLADKEFFEKDAMSSMEHAVRRMVHAVAQADIVFRNTDFNQDGVPDNIGFSVKYIIVLKSEETQRRVFGEPGSSKTIDGRQYLMQFARIRRLSEVCLGVAFTGYAFHNRTLGLSFTSLGGGVGGAAGGLCDRRARGLSFNTVVISHATADRRVPEWIARVTLAHELGHSFGAHHDEKFPLAECRGYIMGSQSKDVDSDSYPTQFSVCSQRMMAATLDSMGYCLVDEDKPYCGNGIVEEGEACDCGLPSRCALQDPCCMPRTGTYAYEAGTVYKKGCSVASGAMCHPSQGLCCTAQCKYANLTEHGIECEDVHRSCFCPVMSALCRCGLGGRCLPDGSCHAAECALQGLRECQCRGDGPGGVLGAAGRCGVCCLLRSGSDSGSRSDSRSGSERCVGAELAAKALLANGTRLLHPLVDTDYTGPRLTVELCDGPKCHAVSLRAWRFGRPCVSRGRVGVCGQSGVCRAGPTAPRTNVYPNIMPHQLTTRSSSTGVSTVTLLVLNTPLVVYLVS